MARAIWIYGKMKFYITLKNKMLINFFGRYFLYDERFLKNIFVVFLKKNYKTVIVLFNLFPPL